MKTTKVNNPLVSIAKKAAEDIMDDYCDGTILRRDKLEKSFLDSMLKAQKLVNRPTKKEASSKTFTLTLGETKLLKDFLDELSRIQGNAGCNDMVLENTDENWKMIHKLEKEQCPDIVQDRPPRNEEIYTLDTLILSHLRKKMGI